MEADALDKHSATTGALAMMHSSDSFVILKPDAQALTLLLYYFLNLNDFIGLIQDLYRVKPLR